MAYNIPRFEFDSTSINPDNLVIDEPHVLGNRDIRSIAPLYGPIYKNNFILRDGVNVLIENVDYIFAELHQEATLKIGKEVYSVILVTNTSVSSNVTITYQTVGGPYLNSAASIANLYEAVINDNRPVDWLNVYNKPATYPPTLHRHLLEDVYGFEPVVDALERIKNAITLGQVDVVIAIIDALLSNFNCGILPKILPQPKLLTYDAMLFFLTNRFMISNYAIEYLQCKQLKGDSFDVIIKTKNIPNNATITLQVYKSSPNINLLNTDDRVVTIINNTARVRYYLKSVDNIKDNYIYIGIKLNVDDEEFLAVTYRLNPIEHNKINTAYPRIIYQEKIYHDFDYKEYYINDKDRVIIESLLEV